MNSWTISGPTKISGEINVHGNKNSSFPCIASSLLIPDVGQSITLQNIPRIRDVFSLCDIIKYLGIRAEWIDEHILKLQRDNKVNLVSIPPEIMSKLRGSMILLGPLMGFYKNFSLPKPGGDKIGNRPLTAHIAAFRDLGFSIEESDSGLVINSQNQLNFEKKEKINKVWLIERSVTATSSLLLFSASMSTNKNLFIYGAACEPHISTICDLLTIMGAEITGRESNYLNISWPNKITKSSIKFRLDDDHIEATTYAIAAAITRSDLIINFSHPQNLELINRYLNWMGVRSKIDVKNKKWTIKGSQSNLELSPELRTIKAEPWPGVPTDIMSLLIVLATQCKGTIKFTEYMYDDRFSFVQTLKDMGASIEENPPHVIKVHGPTQLHGQEAFVRPDIRSGAALLLAALCAKGMTILHDKNNVIERGYEKLPEILTTLGANIDIIA